MSRYIMHYHRPNHHHHGSSWALKQDVHKLTQRRKQFILAKDLNTRHMVNHSLQQKRNNSSTRFGGRQIHHNPVSGRVEPTWNPLYSLRVPHKHDKHHFPAGRPPGSQLGLHSGGGRSCLVIAYKYQSQLLFFSVDI